MRSVSSGSTSEPARGGRPAGADPAIRPARLADVGRLLELYRHLAVGDEPTVPLELAQTRFMELTANPDHRVFVAVADDRIVGTFTLVLLSGLSHCGRAHGIVEDVVVSPEQRSRGVGRHMMLLAMRIAASERCYKLALSSHLARGDAHRFYENLGFRRHGYSFLIDPAACSA